MRVEVRRRFELGCCIFYIVMVTAIVIAMIVWKTTPPTEVTTSIETESSTYETYERHETTTDVEYSRFVSTDESVAVPKIARSPSAAAVRNGH